VLGGQHGQCAGADVLEDLGRVAADGQPDPDQGRVRGNAHHRGDRRPDVVDAVPHGEQAHAGGVLPEGGGERGGVDHGGQSITRRG
jgi:hypothetical protein